MNLFLKTLIAFVIMLPPTMAHAQSDPPVIDPPSDTEPQLPVASIEITDSKGNPVTSEVAVGEMIVITSRKAVHAHETGSLTWRIRPSLQSFTAQDGETLVLNTGLKPQVVEILQIVSLGNKNTYQEMSIRIGNAPQPPPVNPDDPDVEPVPPTPVFGKLYVAIIEEATERVSLPSTQQSIFTSEAIRAYKAKACAKDPDGTLAWKVVDKDLDPSKEPEWVKKAFAEPRASLPWLVFSNGTNGYAGPLPKTSEETLELLKKYGGP